MNIRIVISLALAAMSALAGCGSYKLQGRVLRGDVSYATIVSADDPQLRAPNGLEGVRLRVLTDPDRLNREQVGAGVSGPDGSFSLDIDAFGAGFLEYDIGVEAVRPGYVGVDERFRMPSKGERVLIILAPGRDTRAPRQNLLDEYERFR